MKIITILLFYCLSLWINNIQTQNVPTITDLCKFESIMPLTDTIDGVDIDLSVNNTENNDDNNNNNNNNNNNIIANNNYCICETAHSMPWGLIVLDIDCRDRQFQNIFFNAEILPPNTERIDLSWNAFEFVPDFIGIDLKYLIISHNLIKIIDDNNFDKISLALIELDLSWNHIEIIAINAFYNLLSLNKLDLSGNNLKQLTPNVFSTLPSLKHLILSKNLYLNETFNQTDMNLYLTLGVTTKLQQLEIEECNLNYIDLSHSVGLKLLNLKYNNFNKIPIVPYSIEFFDFSGNRIEQFGPKCLPNLFNLKTLLLEDMTNLTTINDYAFFGLPNLKHISLEGSKKLTKFNSIAFGLPMVKHQISSDSSSSSISTDDTTIDDDYRNNTFDNDNNDSKLCLEILNLRGTKLKTLNSSLLFVFENLKEFHLDGNPFVCNCDVKWLKDFHIETNAQCDSPPKLKGATITKLPGAVFLCKRWTEWVYKFANGLLILLLLILCGVATWLIVMGIRPSRRSKLQKVGALSPYARVTIEPNRAEDNF